MTLIGVFLFAIYGWLIVAIVILPALAFCGFGGLGWWALRIGSARVRAGALGICAAGLLAAVAWAVDNDAVGFLRMVGAGQ